MSAEVVTTLGRTISIEGEAVVWIAEGGGHVHEKKKKCRIEWTNGTGKLVRLRFTDWPEEGGSAADPLWPFTRMASKGGNVAWTPDEGLVYLSASSSFEGTIVCAGLLVVKYDVTVMAGTSPGNPGEPDTRIKALDPLIIVER